MRFYSYVLVQFLKIILTRIIIIKLECQNHCWRQKKYNQKDNQQKSIHNFGDEDPLHFFFVSFITSMDSTSHVQRTVLDYGEFVNYNFDWVFFYLGDFGWKLGPGLKWVSKGAAPHTWVYCQCWSKSVLWKNKRRVCKIETEDGPRVSSRELGGGGVVYKRTCQNTQRNYDKQNSLSSLFAWILLNIYSPIEPCNESPPPPIKKEKNS